MNAPEPIPFKAEGPQPLVAEIRAGEPYPVAALGPLREAVEAVQGAVQAPIAIPAQSALSVASLAVQGFADVETLGGPRPVSVYALTVAQSGERKSSCDAPFMAALRDHEREQADAQRLELESWRNAHALWKGDREKILGEAKKAKGDKRKGAQADLEALGPEPAPPPSPDLTVTEPTYEGLTRKFFEGHPSLGIFSDEGGQFLGGHAMNSDNRQKTLTGLNDLWQGKPIQRTRQGEGAFTRYGRRLAVHLMVQPGVARDFMADPKASDTGFLARFLICEPPSAIGTRFYGNSRQDPEALGRFGRRLQAILEADLPMDPETRALLPRTLPLEAKAREVLVQFHDAIEAQMAPGGDLDHVTGAASKAAEQAARIAGVLTLWRDLDAAHVTAKDMADGITLAQYYLGEAARLADAATVSAETNRAERLRKWLLESWPHGDVTLREVLQNAPIRTLRENAKARAALALLEKTGWAVKLEPGTVIRGAARKDAWRTVTGGSDVV